MPCLPAIVAFGEQIRDKPCRISVLRQRNQVPQTGWLTQEKRILSQLWRPKSEVRVWEGGVLLSEPRVEPALPFQLCSVPPPLALPTGGSISGRCGGLSGLYHQQEEEIQATLSPTT